MTQLGLSYLRLNDWLLQLQVQPGSTFPVSDVSMGYITSCQYNMRLTLATTSGLWGPHSRRNKDSLVLRQPWCALAVYMYLIWLGCVCMLRQARVIWVGRLGKNKLCENADKEKGHIGAQELWSEVYGFESAPGECVPWIPGTLPTQETCRKRWKELIWEQPALQSGGPKTSLLRKSHIQ